MKHERRQFVIDMQTQWRIARHLLLIWFTGGFVVAAFPVFAAAMTSLFIQSRPPGELAADLASSLWFPLMMAVVVAPIGCWWSIRFSNRIAGPVYRFNRDMRRLLDGEPVPPFRLRKRDFFRSLETTFANVHQRLQEAGDQETSDDATSPELVETG